MANKVDLLLEKIENSNLLEAKKKEYRHLQRSILFRQMYAKSQLGVIGQETLSSTASNLPQATVTNRDSSISEISVQLTSSQSSTPELNLDSDSAEFKITTAVENAIGSCLSILDYISGQVYILYGLGPSKSNFNKRISGLKEFHPGTELTTLLTQIKESGTIKRLSNYRNAQAHVHTILLEPINDQFCLPDDPRKIPPRYDQALNCSIECQTFINEVNSKVDEIYSLMYEHTKWERRFPLAIK